MKVNIIAPYRQDKNLGLAYNEAMQDIGENDFACLHDIDVSFLTPDAGNILYNYARLFPKAHLLTCFTNRVSSLSKMQLLTGRVDENTDYKRHIQLAEKQKHFLYSVTELKGEMSGMLMLISKKNWLKMPFPETGQCLGVDTAYGNAIQQAGKVILRMEGLYVFHGYRLLKGINNKEHLKV